MMNDRIGESCRTPAHTLAPALFAQPAASKVDLGRAKAPVSPTLYGLMTEEINYSYDGGLYAELVRNRTFRSDWSGILNWYLIEKGTSSANIGVDTKEGPSAAIPNSAKLEVTRADANSPPACSTRAIGESPCARTRDTQVRYSPRPATMAHCPSRSRW